MHGPFARMIRSCSDRLASFVLRVRSCITEDPMEEHVYEGATEQEILRAWALRRRANNAVDLWNGNTYRRAIVNR